MRSPLRPVAAIVRAVAAPAVGAAAFALSSVAAAQTVVIDPTLPIAAQVPSTSTNPPTGPTAPTTATPPATQAPALSTTSAPTAPSPEPLAGWYGFETLAVDAAGLVAGGIAYNVSGGRGRAPEPPRDDRRTPRPRRHRRAGLGTGGSLRAPTRSPSGRRSPSVPASTSRRKTVQPTRVPSTSA